jgi:RHS repeat-associated protein
VSRKDFAAFGDEVATPQRTQGLGYQPTGLRQDYTGYEKDDESGLEFAQARYYNPTHGRFTSVDPLTASATIRNPQTFNRYAYALNSPYKFTGPLGLIPSSTGACGGWCQNNLGMSGEPMSVDGSAFRGQDASFYSMFEALVLAPFISSVEEALAFASNVGNKAQVAILQGFLNIFNFGNSQSRQIAMTLYASDVTFAVLPTAQLGTSGTAGVTDVAGANAAIAAGSLTVQKALSFITITIAAEELSNAASVEANIIHEGTHALIMATVLSSLSTGNPKKYQNETESNGEKRSTTAAAKYLRDRGGLYASYGTSIKLLDSTGKKLDTNFINSKSQGTGNVLQYFRALGITWKHMLASY